MTARSNRVASSEQFALLPWRITEKLIQGLLTRDEYVTLTYLVAKVTRDLWLLPREERVLITELAVIKAETGWTKTTARLRQVLESLVELGWITTTTTVGNRKWEIRLTGALVRSVGDQPAKSDAQDFELSSKREGPVQNDAPHDSVEICDLQPRNAGSSLDVDVDVETTACFKEEIEGPLDHRAQAAGEPQVEPARGLVAEVLEAVNRARLQRGDEALASGLSFYDKIGADDEALLDRIAAEIFDGS